MSTHKEGYMTNAAGHLVPIEGIKPADLLEDNLVHELFGVAKEVSLLLADLKSKSYDDIDAFVQLLSEKYKLSKGGRKGNMTLTSFDGMLRIVVSNADFITFGPQLQIAKQLIDEFIEDAAEGINVNIRTIVFHAFRVNKIGQVNKATVLGLRRLDIKGEKWERAMEAITESIRIAATKRYIRFYKRDDITSTWQPLSLDIAAV